MDYDTPIDKNARCHNCVHVGIVIDIAEKLYWCTLYRYMNHDDQAMYCINHVKSKIHNRKNRGAVE